MGSVCCEELKQTLLVFSNLYFPIGKGEISGSCRIDAEGVHIYDGWNDLPDIPFRYCPFCGKKQGK